MNKGVLKRVCQFLEGQKDNEAFFATFWDKTKDFYPKDQSKTKVKKWLQEHPGLFEVIAGKNGNPFEKIRLKTAGRNEDVDRPSTTTEEDEEIISTLIETIDKQDDGELLFAVICAQKATLFPPQLLNKKYIKQWLSDHKDYFQILTDQNGGINSVRVTQQGRQRQKRRGVGAHHKRKQQLKQEVISIDRVQETSATLEKISQFIETYGGSIALYSLVQQEGILPAGISGNDSVRSFLANFPGKFQLVNTPMYGERVSLVRSQNSNDKTKKIASPLQSWDPNMKTTQYRGQTARGKTEASEKVVSFLCEHGGTAPFAEVLKQASELIDGSINSNEGLFSWLSSNDSHFEILPSPNGSPYGHVKVRLNIKPRFCQNYLTEKKCPKENCAYLHICKAFVCGVPHSQDMCGQSHDIHNKHNKAILNQSVVLQKCNDQVIIKVLLKSCFPRVCTTFNKNKEGTCPKGEKCNFLHICGDFVLNQCPGCNLSHNIVDGLHNIQLLKRYALLPSKNMPVEMVKTNIAYVKTPNQDISMPCNNNSEKLAKKKKKLRSKSRRHGTKSTQSSDKADSKPADSASGYSQSDATSDSEELHANKFLESVPLKANNINKSFLNTSLSFDQKVESWMSGTSGYAPAVDQPRCKRSQSLSGTEESVESSIMSSQNSFQLTQPVKKVFMTICIKYNGSAPFHQVSKNTDLFPPDLDVSRWFKDHPNSFIVQSNGRGKIERVNAFSRRCRPCLDYSSKTQCSNDNCHYFHICRNFVEGCCPNGSGCDLDHDFKSIHNSQLAKRFHLNELTDAQLSKLMQLSTPNVCNFYNKGHCNRGVNCPNIHICKKFAKRKCGAKDGCPFGHLKALETTHSKKLLDQYGMGKQKPNYICKMLFVCAEKPTDQAMNDSKGETEVQKECPKICSQFLTGQCHERKKCKCIHHDMPYLWQFKLTSPSANWSKLSGNDCENIEKLFCDVNCTAAELSMTTKIMKIKAVQSSPPHSSVRLDFQSMSGRTQHPSSNGHTEFYIRRLESDSRTSTSDGEWFKTRWMWYKLGDSNKWIKYDANLIGALEEGYLDGTIQIDTRSFRRRPAIFLSQSEVQDIKKRTSSEASLSQPPEPKPTVHSPVSGTLPQSIQSTLCSSAEPPTNQCHRVKVEPGTQDYHTIDKLLRGSIGQVDMKINNIEKIRNAIVWKKYVSKKKHMTDQLLPGESVNEQHLFMPCRHDDVERIMKDNVYVSRLDVPDVLGPGHYFTNNASLCLKWCTENRTQSRFLLVCQVLLGTYTQGSANMTTRPRRHDSRFYDSLVDDITEPKIFVVSDVDQCYPAFIIDFSYTQISTEEVDGPLWNLESRDSSPPFVTQPRGESVSSPTIPTNACSPDSIGHAAVNHPLSSADVASQHSASAAGFTSPVRYSHADVITDSTVSSNAPQLDDFVKAPPPYSERPVDFGGGSGSHLPPSYSEGIQRPTSDNRQQPSSSYPQQAASGYAQRATGYPQQPASSYPQQAASGYPQQPASGESQQPASGYPHQSASGYAQPATGYPQQPSSGYSQQSSSSHCQQPPYVYPQPPSSGYPQPPPSSYPHPTSTRQVTGHHAELSNQRAAGKDKDCVVM